LRVFPCASLDNSAKIVNIKLTNLPLLPKHEVLKGFQKSLAMFGSVMDLRVTTESAGGFFMGSGYAILNVHQSMDTLDEKKKKNS
jgi:superoxide dismutase